MHSPQVRDLAHDFGREAGRHYYATPTSYLELIQTYKELLKAKRTTVGLGLGCSRCCGSGGCLCAVCQQCGSG